VSECERRKPERGGPKIYVSRAAGVEKLAQQSGAQSGERRSQKWERGTAKQPASLRSNALHRSNRVSAEKIASYIFVLIVYSLKVQLDSTTINSLSDLPERYSVSVPPMTNNMVPSTGVVPRHY